MSVDVFKQFDHPLVNSRIFFPRKDYGYPVPDQAIDLAVEVAEGVQVGLRLHQNQAGSPVVLHFHGNGEIVSDYDELAPIFQQLGASVAFADYRGYGRSTGNPSTGALLEDAHRVLEELLSFLREQSLDGSLVVMGRSLGSAPAIELASSRRQVEGLIVESGFAQTIPLLETLGVPVRRLGVTVVEGLDNEDKMALVKCPTLVLHAQNDQIIPVWHAERNHSRLQASPRELVIIPKADHNTIMAVGGESYWRSIADLLAGIQVGAAPTLA